MTTSPSNGLQYLTELVLDPAPEVNLMVQKVDALLPGAPAVLSFLATPPGTPADGDRHIVIATATGAWVGQEGKLARYVAADTNWEFYDLILAYDINTSKLYINNGGWSEYLPAQIESLPYTIGDETTVLTTGTGKFTFRMPYAFTLTEVRASLSVAGSTSGVTTIDINEGGASIFSTPITIDQGSKTSVGAATPAVISDASLADDAEMTVDIDGLSGGATEAGLKIVLIGKRT